MRILLIFFALALVVTCKAEAAGRRRACGNGACMSAAQSYTDVARAGRTPARAFVPLRVVVRGAVLAPRAAARAVAPRRLFGRSCR